MARLNIDILEISELKGTQMREFNSDDYHTYSCGQESIRRNIVTLTVNKESKMQYLGAILKTIEWFVCFQGKSFNITVIQVYAPTINAEEVNQFVEDLQIS